MKGFFFFTGSILRWIVKKPKISITLIIYYSLIYIIQSNPSVHNQNGGGFIFTIGLVTPLLIAIGQGLPLDCLDYKAAISRETEDAI